MLTYHARLLNLITTFVLLLLSACAGQSPSQTPTDSYQKQYQFKGHAQYPSRLTLSSQENDIIYSARVSEFNGKIMTTVQDTSLPTIDLLIPVGDKQYFVYLSTTKQTWLDQIHLEITTITSQQNTHQATFANIAFSASPPVCEIRISENNSIYLYTEPISNTSPLLMIPANIPYTANSRTLDGWYRLTIDARTGWVNGADVQLTGDCASLPVDTMIQPTSTVDANTTAPYDVDRHYFNIDPQQTSVFTNQISYPTGDSTDYIQATTANIRFDRTIGVMMMCEGNGAESLRWGYIENASFGCGDSLSLDFTATINTVPLVVMLPAVSGQQYVNYQLRAMPIAPDDEDQQVLYLDRQQGGSIQQSISYPIGDIQDTITVYAHNLLEHPPDNYRQYMVSIQCSGTGIEFLRWGKPDTNTLTCNDWMPVNLSDSQAVEYLAVNIIPNDAQSFVDYTLSAIPFAPADNTFWFGVDRDNGGIFNETLSAPYGDTIDTIEVIMSNLTATAPNHFREMTLTLNCQGHHIDNIRWGLPTNPSLSCGQTVTTAFIHSANQQTIQIISLDTNVQTYANYSLVVASREYEAILKNASD